MNANEAIDKIVKLLGLKFQKENFFVTVLDDGVTEVTNNTEGELQVGDTLYVIGESTLTPAPAGTHTTREGLVVTVDEESTITKIEVTTAEAEVEVEEDQVEVESKKEEMESDFATQIEQLKSGITQLLEVMNSMNGKFKTEINSLKEDFEKFKNAPERKPLEKKANFKESFDDFRVEFLKEMRGK